MSSKNPKLDSVKKANALFKDSMKSCSICPRNCRVDRTKGRRGYCRAPLNAVIYSHSLHHGEEPALSGTRGSGTIFFSHCNMKCVYCQNYYFSQLDEGREAGVSELAGMMLELERKGCHNINLVSPSHFVPQITAALEIAMKKGLRSPIVYNTSGYDSLATIKALSGVVDIYMPDMRYSDNKYAKNYSDAPDYVERNHECVIEMQKQVGSLALDENGIALKGLIIRLLALPAQASGIKDTLNFIKENIGKKTYLSIMSQYYPTFKAYNFCEISRRLTREEYKNTVDEARLLGLNNGWVQEPPTELDPRFLGTNIRPKEDIK